MSYPRARLCERLRTSVSGDARVNVGRYLAEFTWAGGTGLFDEPRRTRVEWFDSGGCRVPRYVNEYWTSGQRGGHSLHEISYRACFKAELPRFFMERLTESGALVYDPFMGRGTALLEAALLGRRVAGNDVNPLSELLLRPRLDPPTQRAVEERLAEIPPVPQGKADIDLSMFYSPATEAQVMGLRAYLLERAGNGAEDSVDRWIRMVATNRLTGHSAGFFSVYTMPPNQAVSAESQRKINERRGQAPPDRDVTAITARKSAALLRGVTGLDRERLETAGGSARLFQVDAAGRSPLEDGCVDLVVTSPPFLDIVQYASDNWLRCWFNGIDAGDVAGRITTPKSVDEWARAMEGALSELARVVRPGGWVAFEVGEVRGGRLLLDEVVAPLGPRVGLECHGVVVNDQQFTKTANCWGVRNNRKGTNTNRIVVFRKSR